MGHTTDELIELAAQVSADPHPRELDMLLTAGERISMALVSMAINDLGREAVSFTGSQAGIVTDTSHGKARIVEMRRGRVQEALDEGKIVIVAGFQGVSTDARRDDARPRRLRHDRGRAGSGARAPTSARSTPTSTASSPPIRGSCKDARKLRAGLVRGDARAGGVRARACSRCARSSTLVTTA